MSDESNEKEVEWLRPVVDRHAAALVRYAASIVRDHDVARDLVQETFVRLWREPRANVSGHLEPWLFRVCRNLAIDHLRREGRMTSLDADLPTSEPIDVAKSPAAVAEARDSHSRLLQFLETLPANQRDVVRLKFQNGLSYKEIAEVTRLSVGNVGFLLHTALQTLRTRLIAAGE